MVRLIGKEDQAEWLRMRRNLWPDCPDDKHLYEMSYIIEGKVFESELGWNVFVYERDDKKLGGFIELSIKEGVEGFDNKPIGYIEGWYVDSDLRGKGIGKQLVEKSEEWALKSGFVEMGSDVELDNSLSLAIHRYLGYKQIGINEEGILLKKRLV